MPVIKFNTGLIPHEKWSEVLEEVFSPICGMDFSVGSRPPGVEVEVFMLPRLGVSSNHVGAHKAHRTHRHICDGDDSVLIAIPRQGVLSVKCPHRVSQQCYPGSVVVASAEKVFSTENERFLHSCVIRVGREWFASQIDQPDNLMGRLVSPANPDALQLLLSYVDTIVSNGNAIEGHAMKLIDLQLHELIALALGRSPEPNSSERDAAGIRRFTMQQINKYIHSNIRARDLTIGAVAHACNVSPQYVRKLFNKKGLLFSEYVNGLRLEWVYSRLENPSLYKGSIHSLALQAGFNNMPWFNRQFKRRFGVTPSNAREIVLRKSGANHFSVDMCT